MSNVRGIVQISPFDDWRLDQVIAFCQDTGLAGLAVKTSHGFNRQTNRLSSGVNPDNPATAAAIAGQRARVNAAGLIYATWSCPSHLLGQEAAQAQVIAEAANNSDLHLLDVEDGPDFWGSFLPVGDARRLMEEVRARAPEAYLVLQPDPRPDHLAAVRPEEWVPHVNALAGQWYWTTFRRAVGSVVDEAITQFGDVPSLDEIPTFPGDASEGDMQAACQSVREAGAKGVLIWHYDICSPEVAGAVATAFAEPAIEQESDLGRRIYSNLVTWFQAVQALRADLPGPDFAPLLMAGERDMNSIKQRLGFQP
jgi:hypothetical protein